MTKRFRTILARIVFGKAVPIASFVGRVESILPDVAHVILVNEAGGEESESQIEPKKLAQEGLAVGDEFRFLVSRNRYFTVGVFVKLAPKTI